MVAFSITSQTSSDNLVPSLSEVTPLPYKRGEILEVLRAFLGNRLRGNRDA